MAKPTGGAAFPEVENHRFESGMTRHDYFAAHCPPMPSQYQAQARQQSSALGRTNEGNPFLFASWALAYADAMIELSAK